MSARCMSELRLTGAHGRVRLVQCSLDTGHGGWHVNSGYGERWPDKNAPPAPDPRDAELTRLRERVRELREALSEQTELVALVVRIACRIDVATIDADSERVRGIQGRARDILAATQETKR